MVERRGGDPGRMEVQPDRCRGQALLVRGNQWKHLVEHLGGVSRSWWRWRRADPKDRSVQNLQNPDFSFFRILQANKWSFD